MIIPLQDFESKKREVLDRVDLLSLASERVKLHRKGRRWVGLCPFHSEKTPSFTVSPDMGFFKCFGCGKGGDLFTFVEEIERVSFMEAFEILADRAGVDLARTQSRDGSQTQAESDGSEGARVSRADLAKVNEWAMSWFRANLADGVNGRSARAYLDGRSFTDDALATFEVGLATADSKGLLGAARSAGYDESLLIAADLARQGESGGVYATFRNRLMFPIRDAMSRVVGFGGRTLVEDPAKYLNTRQTALFDKGRGLFGVHLARGPIKDKGRAIVVEGYTDCMAAHQAGFGETVATLGTALTDHQVDLLHRYCDDVILLFDSDQAGEAAADRAIRVALPRCVAVRLARIPDGKDPSEFLQNHPVSAFEDVLNRSIGALEFKWNQTRSRFGGGASDANRREAVLDFMGVVAEATQTRAIDVIQRGLMINQVAHLLQMNRAGVDRLLAGLQRRGSRAVAKSEEHHASRNADSSVAHSPIPRDQEQASWTCLLEVVLNEPGLLGTVEDLPDFNRITSPCDRSIAEAAWNLFDKYGAFTMADMLARSRNREFAERVAALASRGSARANFEPTFRAALERISRCSRTPKLDERARALYGSAGVGAGSTGLVGLEEADDSVIGEELIRKELCGHRHFAPRRLLRRALGTPSGSAPEPQNPATSLE